MKVWLWSQGDIGFQGRIFGVEKPCNCQKKQF